MANYKSAQFEVEVLDDLKRLSYELSMQENRRVTLSDTLRLLLETYNMQNRLPSDNQNENVEEISNGV